MPIQSDNRRSGLGKRQISSVMLASLVLLSQTVSLSSAIAATTTNTSSKPVLKAIDPSQAKMDSLPKPQAPPSSLNPAGGIQGAPISANKPSGIPGQPAQGWAPQYQQPGYPAPQYGAPQGYPQYQQPPAGYPPQYQQGYPAPSAPPGYPSYPPQQPYGYPQQPAYGAPYGQPYQSAPVTSPPGYPTMPPAQPAYPNYNTPPGFVQPGGNAYRPPGAYQPPPQNAYQQPPPSQGNFPAGRSQYGGGHPNLVPQGTAQSGPQSSPGGYGGPSNFASNPAGGSYQQPPGFVQPQGGYPQQPPSYGAGGGGAPTGQFASNNYPSPNLIPDFGKPLPLDASSRGPAQMWTTNQVVPAGGNPATGYGATPGAPPMDPNEARVARLEKIAFGSTYPEHEVEDRVDHLEKEIFTDKSTGDLQERLNRLERKLCGGTSGSFGSPMKQSGQYGSYAGGSSSVAVAPSVPQLALKSPDDPPSSQGSVPSDSSSGSSDDDEGSASQSSGDDSTTAQDDAGSMDGESSDDDASSASDTADGVSTPKGKGPAASDLKAMATGTSSQTEASTKGRTKSVAPRIPYDKGAGDYANRISRFVNNSTARWTTFPVRVRLPEGENNDWKKSMEVGLEKWGRYIPLKTATVSETADIEVSFVNHLTPRVLGVTRLTVTGGRMKVFVFMLRPNYYPAIPEKVLAHAFMHELGHAIGIFGHSDKPNDAMFTFEIASNGKLTQEKLGTLSTRDVNTLKVIYDAKPLPEDFNMSAPQEWGYTHESS